MQFLTSKAVVKPSATLWSPFKCFCFSIYYEKESIENSLPYLFFVFLMFLYQQIADLIVISVLFLINFEHPQGMVRCFKHGAEK